MISCPCMLKRNIFDFVDQSQIHYTVTNRVNDLWGYGTLFNTKFYKYSFKIHSKLG